MRRESRGGVERVGAPHQHEGRHVDRRQSRGEVEAEQRGGGGAGRVTAARREHLAGRLDVARVRVVAEADPCQQEPEVAGTHERGEVGTQAREPFERLAHAAGVTDQVVRRGRLQHQPAHALVQHVRVTDGEGLHRHPAHRVPDQHHVAQVEALEHAAKVVGQVVDRVAGVAGHRLAVPAGVEGHRAEPCGGERLELLRPDARREGDPVAEHHRRPVSPRDGVDRAAVVTVEDAHGVVLGDEGEPGVGILAVAQARHEGALRRVGDADGARGHAGDDPGALQRPRRHQTGRFRRGVPAIRPRRHCISITWTHPCSCAARARRCR